MILPILLSLLGGAAALAAPPQLINGVGSSLTYSAFTNWFAAYGKANTGARFNFQPIGSDASLKRMLERNVDFGVCDAPLTDADLAAARGKILHLPVVTRGVAIIYNLPGHPKLKLDGPVLANIFLGNITQWNDPRIAALNPGVHLPALPIPPVHRADGRRTSFILTDYLCRVNPAWAETIGKGVSVKWPLGVGSAVKSGEGVARQVKELSSAIGYADLACAEENQLPCAEIKNAAGNFISPAPDSVSAALATASVPDDFRLSMVNSPGDQSYPIAGASWVLVYQHPAKARDGLPLVAFLKWAITEGQKTSAALD